MWHTPVVVTDDDFMSAEERRGRFDRAVAYFNARRFYEAHEDWEEIWHESEGANRLWIQGLIQYAAAFVHLSRGFHASGFAKLMAQATEKVRDYDGDTDHVRWDRLWSELQPWIEHGRRVANGADLTADAPGAPPLIHYDDGFTPAPLPLDD